ncbi:MAG: DNA translocase FtsK, partial [Lachnospiraceae bacterium]|nr:DNA translocase FtsK [Lachnospiraceae bacterium]
AKAEEEKAMEELSRQVEISGDPGVYKFPPMSLLKKGKQAKGGDSDKYLRETARKLQDTLHNFGVNVTISNVSCGPTVTRYELQPEQGVKVSKIVNLADDIKLNLATADIRIEAPIPGKAAVGIEVPNKENSAVMLRDLLQSPEFQKAKSSLSFAAGKDIAGKPVITDIAKMPHLLIAGATGSGKSVCINTLIMSVLYKAQPDQVKMIMIDPKVVELSVYNGIPHLLIPVVTDPKKAAGALNWAVAEMTDRYNTFAEYNVRNLEDYSQKIQGMTFSQEEERPKTMPQIVIIVDELADLMMVAPGEVEDAICRLAQLARAAGIHLIIATQRPSVNVITGLIKANMPSRIAFAVSSGVDSRTILDMNGAEKLLGKGDMLFYPQGYQKPARLQGAFVSDEEVSKVVEFLSAGNPKTQYDERMQQEIITAIPSSGGEASEGGDRDAYFVDAGKLIIEKDKASIGMLQRAFKIGFNRAARIMDQLSQANVVGPEEGTKPRKVLMSAEEFEEYIKEK